MAVYRAVTLSSRVLLVNKIEREGRMALRLGQRRVKRVSKAFSACNPKGCDTLVDKSFRGRGHDRGNSVHRTV